MAEDFDDDLVRGILPGREWMRKPRFLRTDRYFGDGEDPQSGLGRYDILQEARAPKAIRKGNEWHDVVLRWETTFSYRASALSSPTFARRRIFRVEPKPTLRFLVAVESPSGERSIVARGTTEEVRLDLGSSNDEQEAYLASAYVNPFLDWQEVASSAVVAPGMQIQSAERFVLYTNFSVWPAKGSSDYTPIRLQEDKPKGARRLLLEQYIEDGKYPRIVRELIAQNSNPDQPHGDVCFWPLVDGKLFVSATMVYYVRADDRIDVSRPSSTPGWCVYVPEGPQRLVDMEVSPPVIRRTRNYLDRHDKWLKPLLEVDSIEPWKLTWETSDSDTHDSKQPVQE